MRENESTSVVFVGDRAPCGCAIETLDLVEASLEPDFVRAYTFRCRACGQSVTTRSAPMRFPVLEEDGSWAESETAP